ncbi:hypothetical protein KJ657_02265 [Patescibacteria group bacterium]|nr:hypothetical protein [Patescibacteria group bacterium]MBU1015892.1 hypothetical protein [Patescibacteria group bacterium]MBU1685061.1 hypothetical protein [Patescibacteria group bacterium]MBU1938176.1 hypothetical protein [Patescibacteria group bacterium]
MKKLVVSLLCCALLSLHANPLLAATTNVPFFEALSNFAAIEDYKLAQSFFGTAEFEEYDNHISAEYRIIISSVIDGGNRTDNFSRLSAYIKLTNHNEVTDSTPFKQMTVQANAELIVRDQQDIYFKLNNFNIGLKEALPFAIMDIENVTAMADLYRGTWFHAMADSLAADSLSENTIDVNKYMTLDEQMKENPKAAILELSELGLKDSNTELSENEVNQFLEVIRLTLETKLFTERQIISGRNAGFRFFNLNKGAIIGLIEKAATAFGEEMTGEEKTMIRAVLNKISLSGIYRINDAHRLIDNLLLRFRLKDAGMLTKLELNYRHKVSDIGKENSVKAPTEYEEWYGLPSGSDEELFHEDEWFEEEPAEESF